MPFISRKNLDDLRQSEEEARESNIVLLQDSIGYVATLRDRDRELDEVGEFLEFLAQHVPDYEGYVLMFLDKKEFGDDPD